jgi:DNA polymerase III alpha subunit (gram-positive type)
MIPNIFIEKIDGGSTGKIIFSDQIVTITKEIPGFFIVEVPNGCQFTGDFLHAGADNVSNKLTMSVKQKFKRWIMDIGLNIKHHNISLQKLLQKLNQHKIKLSKVTRFFCKTYPKDKNDTIIKAKENVQFYCPEANGFENIIEMCKNMAKQKESSKQTVKTISKTKDEYVSIIQRSSPRRSNRQVKDAADSTPTAANRKRAGSAEKTIGKGKVGPKKQKQAETPPKFKPRRLFVSILISEHFVIDFL